MMNCVREKVTAVHFEDTGYCTETAGGEHKISQYGKIENVWSCASALPYVLMAWCLVKHRDTLHEYIMHSSVV